VNLDDVREILALMRENGNSEFEIEREGLKLRLRKDSAAPTVASVPVVVAGMHAAPVAPLAPAPEPVVPALAAGSDTEVELAVVKSPIVGTFYRSPGTRHRLVRGNRHDRQEGPGSLHHRSDEADERNRLRE
jgi:biotin carboxyl carrier protein